jgi:hypothetical protein
MITIQDVEEHAQRYPTFDQLEFLEWAEENEWIWNYYKSVSKANQRRHRDICLEKYCRLEHT